MKNHPTISAALAAIVSLSAVCCTKPLESGVATQVQEGTTTLNLQIGAPQTKVAGQAAGNEAKIQNVQVFVFRAGDGGDAGNLEIAVSQGFSTPLNQDPPLTDLTVKCTTGSRDIWVVVNDSEDRTKGADAVSTKSEFLLLTHDLMHSDKTKLLMIGHQEETLTEGAKTLAIEVKRYVAAVMLDAVVNDFSSPAYQKTGVFRLENAYLLNVPGRINFGHTSDPAAYSFDYWYAKRAAETDPQKRALIYDTLGATLVDYTQTYGSDVGVKHTFYTYPNACAANATTTGDYTARATLLVVEASIKNSAGNWQLYYYPVTLSSGPLESNKLYKVRLTVHRPGSLDPNIPVKFSDVTPNITVSDWVNGESYTPEI